MYEFRARNLAAWRADGVALTTPSDDAALLYDRIVASLYGNFRRAPHDSVDDASAAVQELLQADPHFLLAHILKLTFLVGGSCKNYRNSAEVRQVMSDIDELRERRQWSRRELLHADAIDAFARGRFADAGEIYRRVYEANPSDAHVLPMLWASAVYGNQIPQLADRLESVVEQWSPRSPFYSHHLGIYAMGLQEGGRYDEALKHASIALESNPADTWSTHAMIHVFGMQNRHREGMDFLERTEEKWANGPSASFVRHNFWHGAVLAFEGGEYERSLSIFDKEMLPRAIGQPDTEIFHVVDLASLLYRFHLQGIPVGKRWADVDEMIRAHDDDDCSLAFNTLHCLMSSVARGDRSRTDALLQRYADYLACRDYSDDEQWHVGADIGMPIACAMQLFADADYDACCRVLLPIRDRILSLGGSDLQGAVFQLLLLEAAVRSDKYCSVARQWLCDSALPTSSSSSSCSHLERSHLLQSLDERLLNSHDSVFASGEPSPLAS